MIYQPRSTNDLKMSLDGLNDNQIEYQIATNNRVVAYQFFIYNIDNSIFYDSDKVDLNPNLYNNDILTIPLPADKVRTY